MHDLDLADDYVRWFETLGKTGVHRLGMHVAKDVRYRTPLTEGAGLAAVTAIFMSIFDDAAAVKIKVTDRARGMDGHTVYLRWDRLVTSQKGQIHGLSGVSELMFGMDGKIVSIIDHWDSVPPVPKKSIFARFRK